MGNPRRIVLRREGARDAGDAPPTYTKIVMPMVPWPFAGNSDGGNYVPDFPLGHFDVGQMSALYHQWRYEVTQQDLPPNDGGFWALRTWPTVSWMETIIDTWAMQFDPSWSWPGFWSITYQQLAPQPSYPILQSTRFEDDWVLTTNPNPPTKTWNARLTMTPANAVVVQDIIGVSPAVPLYLRKHDINSVSTVENPALKWDTLVPVCDFYPMMGP